MAVFSGVLRWDVDINRTEENTRYRVTTGPRYRIGKLVLNVPDGIRVPPDILQLTAGRPVIADEILGAERNLNRYISTNYCLYEVDTDYEVILESSTQSAQVTFKVTDSPAVRFGEIKFVGLETIDPEFMQNLLQIRAGDCFKRTQVDADRLSLIQSNLLLGVTAKIGQPADGKAPVTFEVRERAHRTFSAGAGYQTDNGFGISAGWEHRNLLGSAERLEIDTTLAQRFQSLSGDFRVPQFVRPDQTLTLYSDLARSDTDAFVSKSLEMGAELSRQLGNHVRASLGGEIEFSRIEEDDETNDFALLSVPFGLEHDRRRDPLNPTNGWVAAVKTQPYWDGYETSTRFLKSSIAASAYKSFDESYFRPTLAIRGAVGTIYGEERDTIPANLRFYSGGGGSVRGYPFQALGPLDENDDPSGGLSFTEVSMEARLRMSESWGLVTFLDGGFAYENRTPEPDEDLLWGTGIGVRFYTSFAPIRFDIAVPLDKREGIDDSFQIYIGIGQAF